MSCFWNSIISAFSVAEFQTAFPFFVANTKPNPKQLIQLFKKHNKKTTKVTWNGEPLSLKEIEENSTCIDEYNVNSFNQGHWCSTCDPFLLLTCELFNVNIKHQYLRTTIIYRTDGANTTIHFKSSKGHITFAGRK